MWDMEQLCGVGRSGKNVTSHLEMLSSGYSWSGPRDTDIIEALGVNEMTYGE